MKFKANAEAYSAPEPEAMADLACCYFYGSNTAVDTSKAIEWFTKAVEHDDSYSMHNLGVIYYTGEGGKAWSAERAYNKYGWQYLKKKAFP